MIIIQKAYKLFRVNKKYQGKIFPLFVNSNEEIPIGEFIKAKSGERVGDKVKSKLGLLAYRPGWHLSDILLAVHIGIKNSTGKITYMRPNYVWGECDYVDEINYQEEANQNGFHNGKINKRLAYLKHIPENGFYKYKTSPNQLDEWIIAGNIRVNKVLSDKEVENILSDIGYKPMPRHGGEINLHKYGFYLEK